MKIGVFAGGPLTVAMPGLPAPTVEVEHEHADNFGERLKVEVSRGDIKRTYTASRQTVRDAVKDVFEQILADPGTDEFRPAQPKRP
jgi:hypothetical protein